MKINRASTTKKRWIIVVFAIFLVAVAGAGTYALNRAQKNSQSSTTSPIVDSTTSNEDINLDKPTKGEAEAGSDVKSRNVNPSSTPSSNQQNNKLTITAYHTGTSVQIRSTIASNTQEGTCSLTLTNGTSTITEATVGIQALSDYSTCKGWDIPSSKLSSGKWTVKVTTKYQSNMDVATTDVTIP